MSKPLSNLDYLIGRKENTPAGGRSEQSGASSASTPSAVDKWIEEGLVSLATPIMTRLKTAPNGRMTTFELVDALNVSVDNLRPVLDVMANRFGWIDLDKSNLKGDYAVTLTPRGGDYLRNVR